MTFASVAIPRPVRRLFTYSVPQALETRCRAGVRVVVPFGRRRLTGYVIAVGGEAPPPDLPLKAVEAVLDPDPVLDPPILDLTRWAADYYVASWGEMIRAALPGMKAAIRRLVTLTPEGRAAVERLGGPLADAAIPAAARDPLGREILGLVAQFASGRGAAMRLADLRRRIGPRFRPATLRRLERDGLLDLLEVAASTAPRARLEETAVLVPASIEEAGAAPAAKPKPRPPGARQAALLRILADAGGRLGVPELLRRAGAPRSALRALEARGAVGIESIEARPLTLRLEAGAAGPPSPTAAQEAAIGAIVERVAAGRFATCLLHGVTGSGKTEVYLQAMERTIASGRKAIYLVPEIGLTPLLARRVRGRFGEVVALLHSGLSDAERYEEWRRIREGRVDIVLGARSAIFAPLPDLGLIVVDEEHDGSYKQEESPRYNGRDLAIMRGKMAGAAVVLGSATPSMESYYQAKRGRYALLELPERVGAAGLPEVERLDMRREFQEVGRESVLSRRLRQAIEETLARGEQSLILLNRRGFNTFVLCRDCGAQVGCRRCSIAMTLHLREQRLRCHYCDDRRKVPAACPACGGGHLHFGGTGTERLEDRLRIEFPRARIERMDRDTMRGRGAVEGILTRVEQGGIDILVGTQMIAKGHDFPNVTLVGVLAADALLGFPDFRSGERTFQLLSQVAGRSGRADLGGRVIVQAFDADHHAIRSACAHDFQGFAARELGFRRAMNYPPYSALALLLVKDRSFERARLQAGSIASLLGDLGGAALSILGPAPAPLERLRGEYRVQVLVKTGGRRAMQEALAGMLREMDRRNVRVENLTIDVDPLSTL